MVLIFPNYASRALRWNLEIIPKSRQKIMGSWRANLQCHHFDEDYQPSEMVGDFAFCADCKPNYVSSGLG